MKTVVVHFFFFLFVFTACQAGDTAELLRSAITSRQFTVGESSVFLRQHQFEPETPFLFVHLHSDEATADKAVHQVAYDRGVQLLQLFNKRERLVTFTLDNQLYRFDPNRIFSESGIRKTLQLSGRFTEAAFREVKRFSDSLLLLLQQNKPIVAVHNNTDGRFNILQYRDAGSGQVHVNSEQDTDDFFITNDEDLFLRLKVENFNVVLEDASQMEEDGSLSLYCGREGIRYINVEAQHGHLEEQLQMLAVVYRVLK